MRCSSNGIGEPLQDATWATCLAAAVALAGLLAELHAEEYVVGDLKPGNLWVDKDGRIGMSDIDSLQFTDHRDGFVCLVRTTGYTAPEDIGSTARPTRSSDAFVLAVLVYRLLTAGLHPFHGNPPDGSPYVSLDDNLRHGRCRLVDPGSVVLPRWAPPLDLLPRELAALFRQAFGGVDRRRPERRPSARVWADRLRFEAAEGRLVVCGRSESHVHTVERPWCPWCDQAAQGLDSFPGRRE